MLSGVGFTLRVVTMASPSYMVSMQSIGSHGDNNSRHGSREAASSTAASVSVVARCSRYARLAWHRVCMEEVLVSGSAKSWESRLFKSVAGVGRA